MRVIRDPLAMQKAALALRKRGKRVGFVPTMGALHAGHLSLVKIAKKRADTVVMSIYVNPTQFGPKDDFVRYPRPVEKDLKLAREHGVDIVFLPHSLYAKDASTFVEEMDKSQGREGDYRSGHFRGVTTVVSKLFNLVQPHVAVFGQKDAQQCDVIERMVRDLFVPVKIIRAPLLRDVNGLALSSRNAYLSEKEYKRALRYASALKEAVEKKKLSPNQIEKKVERSIRKRTGVKPQYVTWANGYVCTVAKIGPVRLLDNQPYHVKTSKRS